MASEKDSGVDGRLFEFTKLIEHARNNPKRLTECFSELQDSLDVLRVCIKYQTFDLEATRRENKWLKQRIENLMERDRNGFD